MRWTYYIENTQVYPVNSRDLKIRPELEDLFIFAYRKKSISIRLQNRVDIHSTCFDFIKSLETSHKHEKFTLEIKDNDVLNSTYEFSIYDCKFDDYKETVDIKGSIRDQYTAVQEMEDVVVNLAAEDRTDITMDIYSRWLFYGKIKSAATGEDDEEFGKNLGINVSLTILGPEYWAVVFATEVITLRSTETAPVGWTLMVDLDDYIIYQRFPVDFPSINLSSWSGSPLDWSETGDFQWSGYLRNITVFGYKDPVLYGTEGIYNYFRLDFDSSSTLIGDSNMNDFYLKKSIYSQRANYVFTRTYKAIDLRAAFNRVLTYIGFTGSFKSSLLFKDAPETGKSVPSSYTSFWTTYYSKYLIELSEFKKPNAYQNATIGTTTWKDIIEYMCLKHRARWYIDPSGDIRFEHRSFFRNSGVVNIASQSHRIYAYKSNDKPNREFFSENQAWNDDFAQIETLYGTVPAMDGTKENTRSTQLSNFYTDVDGLNSRLEELTNDGFVYVDVSSAAVVKSTGFKTGATNLQNVSLSNANCLNLYHRYNAYQQEYSIGGISVEALSLIKLKFQELEFTSDSIPDYENSDFETKIGVGPAGYIEYPLVEEYKFKAEVIYE